MADFTRKNFNKITLDNMIEYIEKEAPKDKSWFKAVAYVKRNNKHAVPQYNADGTPLMYQVINRKTGKPKLDKFGNIVYRQKVKMVEDDKGKEKEVFNLLKAKREFYKRYFPNELPTKTIKEKPTDKMKDW